MIQAMNSQNLLQKSGMSYTVKQQKVNTRKAIVLNLKQKILNSLCDYSNAFILVTRNITVNANNNTDVAFKNCAPLYTCTTINDVFADEANHIYIAMPMYNLIEYSDNYSDTSGSLWQFKIDKVPANDVDLAIDNSQSSN